MKCSGPADETEQARTHGRDPEMLPFLCAGKSDLEDWSSLSVAAGELSKGESVGLSETQELLR